MHSISLPILITFIVSFVAAFSRIFSATKPFWGFFPPVLQVLLPTLPPFFAALATGASGAQSWTDLTVVFIGAAALLLPGLPSHRSSAPLPSNSGKPPLVGLGMLALCLMLGGCAWFQGSVEPKVEACAPSPATLVSEVATILAGGGGYVAALEQAGKIEGEKAIRCAVEAFLSSTGGQKIGESEAKARGRIFLAKESAK